MTKARERIRKRRQREQMVRSASRSTQNQIRKPGRFKLPEINVPGGRILVLGAFGMALLLAVVFLLRLINPPDIEISSNAVWLTANWTYQEPDQETVNTLMNDLREHDIGAVFLYVSSLNPDGTWSGLASGRNQFTEVEARLQRLVERMRGQYSELMIYAWIEVNAVTVDGYRLDNLQIQNTVANFSDRMMSRLAFDGVLLDVKPIFEENEDYIQVLRDVRREIGVDASLFVAVPPDLTPTGVQLNLPDVIAPGTEWTPEFKQRVALLADQIVVTAYNSYHTNPVDYIEWVTYQVDSYAAALSPLASDTTVLISVPNYPANLPAHDPQVENLEAGLDGARRGLSILDADTLSRFAGVALYSNDLLTDDEWAIYREKWLER